MQAAPDWSTMCNVSVCPFQIQLSSPGHPGKGRTRRAIGLFKPQRKTYLNELDICRVSFRNAAKLVLFMDV